MNSTVIAELVCCTYLRSELSPCAVLLSLFSPGGLPCFSFSPFANYSKTNSAARHTQSLALAPRAGTITRTQDGELRTANREPETRTGPGMNKSVITITRPRTELGAPTTNTSRSQTGRHFPVTTSPTEVPPPSAIPTTPTQAYTLARRLPANGTLLYPFAKRGMQIIRRVLQQKLKSVAYIKSVA